MHWKNMEPNFKTDIKKWLNNLEPMKPENAGFCPNLKTVEKGKAVIFDIYGTLLISSSGDIQEATFSEDNMLQALDAGKFSTSDPSLASFLLEQLREKIAARQKELQADGHHHPEVDIFEVWQTMVEEARQKKLLQTTVEESLTDTIMVFELLSNPVYPMPGMKEIIQELHERNIPLGIVSNAQFYTPVIMNWFLTGELTGKQHIEYFDPEISVFSYQELRAKPDTALFEKIIPVLENKYNLAPGEVFFVGNDMLKDISTAKKTGFRTVLFAGDDRSLRLYEGDERVRRLFPDFILNDLHQITRIVQ